jgi:iron-sulfur cluster assembly protein
VLTITDNAGIIVSDLVSRAVTTDTGGIRIVAADDQFALSVADSPDGSDIVAANGTARVFMEQEVAEVLDDKVLDARLADDGGVQFLISAQPA